MLAVRYAFAPCVMTTYGQIHGHLLRLLYVLAKKQAETIHVHKRPFSHIEHLFGLFSVCTSWRPDLIGWWALSCRVPTVAPCACCGMYVHGDHTDSYLESSSVSFHYITVLKFSCLSCFLFLIKFLSNCSGFLGHLFRLNDGASRYRGFVFRAAVLWDGHTDCVARPPITVTVTQSVQKVHSCPWNANIHKN
jgi:hypothetical protein